MRSFMPLFSAVGFALLVVTSVGAPAAAAQQTLAGIDVSHHNGQPNWAQVKQAGVKFAFAKATEAQTFRDPEYARNKAQAEANGIVFGAYHFARPDKTAGDAAAEATTFVDFAQLNDDNLIPVLDLEDNGGLGARKLKRWAKDWLATVQTQLGVKPMIYTTASFWKARMGNSRWFADHGYRLWVAHWTANPKPAVPATNWGGQGWTMWQYSSHGTVDGITGNVDLDRFRGTSLAPLLIKNNR
jgi:GH25 family lysozyme M1 (1,4-beta-N-acetylmuramidase)